MKTEKQNDDSVVVMVSVEGEGDRRHDKGRDSCCGLPCKEKKSVLFVSSNP